MFDLVEFPAKSTAVTEKFLLPLEAVLIAAPLATVPVQVLMPESASLQPKFARTLLPRVYVAPVVGVVITAIGGVTSILIPLTIAAALTKPALLVQEPDAL
jgi:hypothetical protein